MQRILSPNYLNILLLIKVDVRRLVSTITDPGFRIKNYNDQRQYKKALALFESLSKEEKFTPIVINQTLRSYIEVSNFTKAKDLHRQLSSYLLNNQFIRTTLIRLYSQFDSTCSSLCKRSSMISSEKWRCEESQRATRSIIEENCQHVHRTSSW